MHQLMSISWYLSVTYQNGSCEGEQLCAIFDNLDTLCLQLLPSASDKRLKPSSKQLILMIYCSLCIAHRVLVSDRGSTMDNR
jgi:hypothetical protein